MIVPSELTVTQLAKALGLPRHVVAYRVRHGVIPSRRMGRGQGQGAKRVILLVELATKFPELFEAVVRGARMMDEDDDDY